MLNTIFIQIASYRDPELIPTIEDLISKAKNPELLSFGICLQDTSEEIARLKNILPKKSKIVDVLWSESKGLCWARSIIQTLYDDETWTLQLDSHHRFIQHWDEQLISMWYECNSDKAILTSYASVYEPSTGVISDRGPYKMVADKFTTSGTILFRPHNFTDEEKSLNRPLRARFVSGHFFFTKGAHCVEYKYDPNLYFAGDEISLSIRSYTLGWDLFHPYKNIVWHEYTREGRPKHWGDHIKGASEMAWYERDVISKKRLRKMLREEDNDADITGYDLGSFRTHRDYEIYAGINFKERKLHPDTIQGVEPPCISEENWELNNIQSYELTLKWNAEDIPLCTDYKFIYIGVEDELGNVLFRYDLPAGNIKEIRSKNSFKAIFNSYNIPVKFIIWPVSESAGWLKKVEHKICA